MLSVYSLSKHREHVRECICFYVSVCGQRESAVVKFSKKNFTKERHVQRHTIYVMLFLCGLFLYGLFLYGYVQYPKISDG